MHKEVDPQHKQNVWPQFVSYLLNGPALGKELRAAIWSGELIPQSALSSTLLYGYMSCSFQSFPSFPDDLNIFANLNIVTSQFLSMKMCAVYPRHVCPSQDEF